MRCSRGVESREGAGERPRGVCCGFGGSCARARERSAQHTHKLSPPFSRSKAESACADRALRHPASLFRLGSRLRASAPERRAGDGAE